MEKFNVTIINSTKGIVVDENGKSYEVSICIHDCERAGKRKYKDYAICACYVYMDKVVKDWTSPKTLSQKFLRHRATGEYVLTPTYDREPEGYSEDFTRGHGGQNATCIKAAKTLAFDPELA